MLAKLLAYGRSVFRARSFERWKPFRLERGLMLTRRHGILEIAASAHIWPDVKISILGTAAAPARVRIGGHTGIGDRTQIHACRSVEIGDRCAISWDVTILENNYHAHSKGPIVIADDVWIGCHAIILSGVTIGRGAVVAAGSVVTKDVAPNAVVAGNPARVVRELTAEARAAAGMAPLR
jgi:acetyltransferase-like isoleucine patch superfamily enzyme